MFKKKSELSQVFVFLLSIMVVVFCGFLVINFIAGFTDNIDESTNLEFFNQLEKNYNDVFVNYNSEEKFKGKLSKDVNLICFRSWNCENMDGLNETMISQVKNFNQEDFNILRQTEDKIFLFSKKDILESKSIEKFYTEPACVCKNITNRNFFVYIENRENQVYFNFNV